ncbi:hypothetical protein CN907_27585 [Bacillus anthracis]|nr:hypothetical protein CN907_27585 [Bacillus anthracis]
MFESENIMKMCVIITPQKEKLRESISFAINERADNASPSVEMENFSSSTHESDVLELALTTRKLWKNGRTLNVRFLNGDTDVQEKIMHWAKEWEKYANIKFSFDNNPNAEIRVSIGGDDLSWSTVGTDALTVQKEEATTHFGWLTPTTPDDEVSRVVLHEFGHVLGCIHEHQNPDAHIHWDKDAVFDYFRRTQGWDDKTIEHNIFETESASSTNFSKFDKDSIMLYSFPPELTTDHKGTPMNRSLSKTDKEFMEKMYPRN